MLFFETSRKRPSLFAVLASYLLLLAAKIADAAMTDRVGGRAIVIPCELLIFALPAAIYLILRRKRRSPEVLRITPPRPSHIPLALASLIALICGSMLLSILCRSSASRAEDFALYETFVSSRQAGLGENLYLIFTYALLPAVCEEFLFRSVLCSDTEKSGAGCAVLVSSLLFAMLHFDVRGFAAYFFAGLILSLTFYSSGSIFVPITVHMLYNIFGLYLRPYVAAFYNSTGSPALFIIFTVALLLAGIALFCSLSAKAYRKRAADGLEPHIPHGMKFRDVLDEFAATVTYPPAIICIIVFIVTVIVF